jgi:hypothetical protein
MSTLRSIALDVALVLAFVVCTAHAQVISWSRGLTASTTLTIGVRLDPTSSRWIDSRLRPLSPYRDARRPNGAYLLPDYRLTAHVCDVQHLAWLGIGNWHGWRAVPQVAWVVPGILGGYATGSTAWPAAAMATFTGVRTATIPGYHFDPLGYGAFGAWAMFGAHVGARVRHYSAPSWRLGSSLLMVWLVAEPWATPWPADPGECAS